MKKWFLVLTAVVSAQLAVVFTSNAQAPVLYRGLLHAHTLFSDGSGTPEEAYKMADSAGLDFFAITEHNHDQADVGARNDGVQVATQPALYNGPTELTIQRNWKENGTPHSETITVTPLIKAATEATTTTFLPIYGQEFSTISSGNHMNLFGVEAVIQVENGNYKQLKAWIDQRVAAGDAVPVLQLNHPDVQTDLFYSGSSNSTKAKMYNDYGIDAIDFGPHFNGLIAALDPMISLIEVLSGPATKESANSNRYSETHENDYYFYLRQGFHISPSAGQDNHYKTWGTITDARTGVYASALTRVALFDALRNNRTFACEDKNMEAYLKINGSLMGSTITSGEDTELNVQVVIADSNEPTASYRIEVYGGAINAELSTNATNWKASDGLMLDTLVTGQGTITIKGVFSFAEPWFYFVKVIQEDGDRLWSAPVWVNYNTTPVVSTDTTFYWTASTSSSVYHMKDCSSVDQIKPENLRQGTTPPTGRRLHDCDLPVVGDH